MTIAEGNTDHKVDASVVLGVNKVSREYVLRTTLDHFNVWRAKHSVNPMLVIYLYDNPFPSKQAFEIDDEIWVFEVDSTKPQDLSIAVRISMYYYNAQASDLFGDIYVKNLNAEGENKMEMQALVRANKHLYKGVSQAIQQAATLLGIHGAINLWIFSNKVNEKIPHKELVKSLKSANAETVTSDFETKRIYHVHVGSNDGDSQMRNITHLH
ncbi:hypothetical protein [Hahella sp. HN01]|uniref:hypothetical protein n=1 Tax=Hahella sp. HN01 TaxID=2847262 RepID=UPI001C1E8F8E|nr:hypothetical protein [Hahella sp. HN01]MBU6950702.1 hypothetical protein [Hahella sp. HN01]